MVSRRTPGNNCRRCGRFSRSKFFAAVCFFISITGSGANLAHLAAQQVTTVAPPAATDSAPATEAAAPQGAVETPEYPDAVLLPPADQGTPIFIGADTKQSQENNVDILDGDAVITFRDRSFAADHRSE